MGVVREVVGVLLNDGTGVMRWPGLSTWLVVGSMLRLGIPVVTVMTI